MVTSDGHLIRSGEPFIRSPNTHNYDLIYSAITGHEPSQRHFNNQKLRFYHFGDLFTLSTTVATRNATGSLLNRTDRSYQRISITASKNTNKYQRTKKQITSVNLQPQDVHIHLSEQHPTFDLAALSLVTVIVTSTPHTTPKISVGEEG
jgi:hypothetical protein